MIVNLSVIKGNDELLVTDSNYWGKNIPHTMLFVDRCNLPRPELNEEEKALAERIATKYELFKFVEVDQ
jgi:hypothetical protein